ncbi:GPI-anchored surface protein, putative [Bodo saltans]|uniref:GPI-anchored surface protein, putative n=1 Tax=Bodo saltans TaxID=75058 RepID=A0A0S4IVZ9_BODSA|nr:GPI-anchored surface protein, putative [Bodo saltans]|eukprot:CUF95014.1 GPI-anchored surface protein, putative [Bodo saltans]
MYREVDDDDRFHLGTLVPSGTADTPAAAAIALLREDNSVANTPLPTDRTTPASPPPVEEPPSRDAASPSYGEGSQSAFNNSGRQTLSRSLHQRLALPPVVFVGTRAVLPMPHHRNTTPAPWLGGNSSPSDDGGFDAPRYHGPHTVVQQSPTAADASHNTTHQSSKRSSRHQLHTPDHKGELLNTRRDVALERQRRKRGLCHLQPTVLHLGELADLQHAALQSDKHMPLQRHIGVRSPQRKAAGKPRRRGVEFSDMALLGATVAGGTTMGLTLHHHPDDALLMDEDEESEDDDATHRKPTRAIDAMLLHISVASHSPTGLVDAHIENILSTRRFRQHRGREAEARRSQLVDLRRNTDRAGAPPPGNHTRSGDDERPECRDLNASRAVARIQRNSDGSNKTFSHTLNTRLKDMSTLVAPHHHKVVCYDVVSTEHERREARRNIRVPLPAELANEFVERQVQRLHHDMTPASSPQASVPGSPLLGQRRSVTALDFTKGEQQRQQQDLRPGAQPQRRRRPSGGLLEVPLSLEMSYQAQPQHQYAQHVYGGGAAFLLTRIFGLDKPVTNIL